MRATHQFYLLPQEEILKMLIQFSDSPNERSAYGDTPIQIFTIYCKDGIWIIGNYACIQKFFEKI